MHMNFASLCPPICLLRWSHFGVDVCLTIIRPCGCWLASYRILRAAYASGGAKPRGLMGGGANALIANI